MHPECLISCFSQAERLFFNKRAAEGTLFATNAFFGIEQYYFFHLMPRLFLNKVAEILEGKRLKGQFLTYSTFSNVFALRPEYDLA